MRIYRPRGYVINLGKDSKLYQDGGPKGHDFRRRVREIAKRLVRRSNRPVEVYVSAREGGWMAEQYTE